MKQLFILTAIILTACNQKQADIPLSASISYVTTQTMNTAISKSVATSQAQMQVKFDSVTASYKRDTAKLWAEIRNLKSTDQMLIKNDGSLFYSDSVMYSRTDALQSYNGVQDVNIAKETKMYFDPMYFKVINNADSIIITKQ